MLLGFAVPCALQDCEANGGSKAPIMICTTPATFGSIGVAPAYCFCGSAQLALELLAATVVLGSTQLGL